MGALIVLLLLIGRTEAKICNEVSSDLAEDLPDLACCAPGKTLPLESFNQQCLYTSHCNIHGVCCADPGQHERYEKSSAMAQNGHCCESASDCANGNCIGGACWPHHEVEDEYHSQKIQLYLLGIGGVLMLCCATTCCYLRNLRKRIQAVPETKEERRNTLVKQMKDEAAKAADPEALTNRNIIDDPKSRINSEQRKNEGIIEPEKVSLEFIGDTE